MAGAVGESGAHLARNGSAWPRRARRRSRGCRPARPTPSQNRPLAVGGMVVAHQASDPSAS
jgi:hypothetical protein